MCRICYTPTPDNGGRLMASSALGYKNKYHKNGSVHAVSVLGGSDAEIAFVMHGLQQWSEFANIVFVYSDDWRNADCRVQLDPSGGSYSYVGTDNQLRSPGAPTMNLGWLESDMRSRDYSTVIHEGGHYLGLGHEHQNPNEPFDWDEPAVIKDLSGAPNNWGISQIRHNVLDAVSIDQVDATTLDRESIMMYFFPDHWVKSGIGTKQNKVLSRLDKEFIGLIYPKETNAVDRVDEFISELLYSDKKINRLDKSQLKLVLDELSVSYETGVSRRDLRRLLKDAI